MIKNRITTFYNPKIVVSEVIPGLFVNKPKYQLQKKLLHHFEIKNLFLTGSGRYALKIALELIGISKGDEVILPSFICASVADAVLEAKGIPVFCDNDCMSFNVSPQSVEDALSDKTKVIIVAHMGGIPAKLREFDILSKKYGIPVIEDCAQSFGSKYNGVYTGLFGDYGFFSFGISKNLSGVGGGVLISKKFPLPSQVPCKKIEVSEIISQYVTAFSSQFFFGEKRPLLCNKIIRNQSEKKINSDSFEKYARDITHIEAALALKKLQSFPVQQKIKNENADIYIQNLRNYFDFISIEKNSEPSFLYFPLLCKNNSQVRRTKKFLLNSGIETKDQYDVRYCALWKNKKFKQYKHYGENVLDIDERYLLLPLWQPKQVTEKICNYLLSGINNSQGKID